MSFRVRLGVSLLLVVVCHFAFPLALGAGGALALLERRVDDRWAVGRADVAVRLLFDSPDPAVDPLLVLVESQSPNLYRAFVLTSLLAPGFLFFVASSVLDSVVRIWLGALAGRRTRGKLPAWPLSPTDAAPSLCIGELHHKIKLGEASHPKWLIMPEKGLYTGLAIFGAIGTGKTTSCMRPFCRQLLEWQSTDTERRVAALILEVKGDFCYDVQEMLQQYGRFDDYMEVSLDRDGWRWNPLNAPWLDTYSLAYTIASLVNQLFGKSKEPFWQQAYTNAVRWIIEVYRNKADSPWFTFADIYSVMLDKSLLETAIDEQTEFVYGQYRYEIQVRNTTFDEHRGRLSAVTVTPDDVAQSVRDAGTEVRGGGRRGQMSDRCLGPDGGPRTHTFEWQEDGDRRFVQVGDIGYLVLTWELRRQGDELPFFADVLAAPTQDARDLNAKIDLWYKMDWLGLDEKLRTSIVEGISVFLGIFVVPDIARIFCPPNPAEASAEEVEKLMPPLDEVIESGKVLAFNMPAGTNPALARAAGVMLKQSWLSTLLLRPKRMKLEKAAAREEKRQEKFWRPAVFICDEYQSFVTCGEDDPSGDEKSFALTRQSRCIPIVATQSISSLKSVLGEGEAWRALLQTLRSRIFLSLADDFSLDTASKLLGQVNRLRPSYSLSENTGRASASLLTGRMGGGTASAGLSKSYSEKREALFHPRDINLLGTCQAIAQIFDGSLMRDGTRVYLKPDYRPRNEPYWRWFDEMQRAAR